MEPFVIKDIKIEGLQRTEPGTVFNYLPVQVGDTMTEDKSSEAIKSLYRTGFFKDVRIEADQNILLITVQERPSIADIQFIGLISLNIGILNLLPIPLLDGGYLLFYLIEFVRRKPLSNKKMMISQRVGMLILGLLTGIALYNDACRYLLGS